MDEFERGKALAALVNKYRLTLFDKIRILSFILALFLFFFGLLNRNLQFVVSVYLLLIVVLLILIYCIMELGKFFYIRNKESEVLKTLSRRSLDNLLLIKPNIILFARIDPLLLLFYSKEFIQGFKSSYWAVKIYYFLYIIFFIIFLPFLLLALYATVTLFLNLISPR